jgi:hypothetical protein
MSPSSAPMFPATEVEEDIVIYEEDQLRSSGDQEEPPAVVLLPSSVDVLPSDSRFAFSPLGLPHRLRGGSFMLLGTPRRPRKRRGSHLPDTPPTPPSPTEMDVEVQALQLIEQDRRKDLEDAELGAQRGLMLDFHAELRLVSAGKEPRTPLLTRRILEAREMEARFQRRFTKNYSEQSLLIPCTPLRGVHGHQRAWDC